MRITREHAADNRRKVLEAAVKRFREKGFDGVAVSELMREAGLTHGGFYNHFETKRDLEAQACAAAFDPALARLTRIAAMADPRQRRAEMERYVAAYLSPAARNAAGARCPMVAFAADVSRREPPVQQAYAEKLRAYLDVFAKASDAASEAGDSAARTRALARFSAMAGALTLARSVAAADPALSDEILSATAQTLAATDRKRAKRSPPVRRS